MIEKIEILKGMNGFVIFLGGPATADMLIFPTWEETIKYLSNQAGLWGKTRILGDSENKSDKTT